MNYCPRCKKWIGRLKDHQCNGAEYYKKNIRAFVNDLNLPITVKAEVVEPLRIESEKVITK